jgi:hypothetical protein
MAAAAEIGEGDGRRPGLLPASRGDGSLREAAGQESSRAQKASRNTRVSSDPARAVPHVPSVRPARSDVGRHSARRLGRVHRRMGAEQGLRSRPAPRCAVSRLAGRPRRRSARHRLVSPSQPVSSRSAGHRAPPRRALRSSSVAYQRRSSVHVPVSAVDDVVGAITDWAALKRRSWVRSGRAHIGRFASDRRLRR